MTYRSEIIKRPIVWRVEAAEDDLEIVGFVRRRLKFEPDERQMEVLRSRAKRGILNCTRQWGKSTMAAAKAVHRAYTEPKKTVLVASPSERQSGEVLMKAEEMAAQLDIKPRGDGVNRLSLLFPNGSRIVAMPEMEGTVRGFSVSMLLIDEASQVDDAFYKALRPMLAVSNGDLWLMSTPRGKRGFFYEAWAHGGDRWTRIRVPATECPRIRPEILEEDREEMGALWFQQEYMCEFVDCGEGVFDRDLVESALEDKGEALDLRRW